MKVDRLVVDTNVLISAAISSSTAPARVLDYLRSTSAVLVFSEPTMSELAARLTRAKFDRYVDRNARLHFLADIDAVTEFVGVSGAPMGCRDRSDDLFLETALAGDCRLIITGDSDLLDLNPWNDVQILRPAEVLSAIARGDRTIGQ